MPPKQRVWRRNRREVLQDPPANAVRSRREPPPIIVGQLKPSSSKLPAQTAVLFNQVRERLPLPVGQPTGQSRQQ
jgi:hypothetical protein